MSTQSNETHVRVPLQGIGVLPTPKGRLDILRHFTPAGSIGLAIIIVAVLVAIFAPALAPFDPLAQDLTMRLSPPMSRAANGAVHILGTDELGRDLLSRLIYGARVSMVVAGVSVPISVILGGILGVSAGYLRGLYDDVVMRALDVQLALPFILLALAILTIVGPSFRNIVLLLGITGWTTFGRMLRAETLVLREMEFVLAAKMIGASHWRILLRHILPNTLYLIIVLATLHVPNVIISEASLSFLGLGIQPPAPSWGGMLSRGRDHLQTAWWVPVFPGICISVVILGSYMLGDWVSDVLDPRRRRR